MGSAIAACPSTPASRQKNCNNCVQAKRRCDRRTPICSRCVEKKTTCVYSKSKTAHRSGKNTREPAAYTETLPLESPAYSPLNIPGLSFDMNYPESISTGFHPEVAVEPTPQSNHDTVSSRNISMDTFMHFIENNTSSPSDQWLIRTEEDHIPERPATPAEEEVVTAYSKMVACVSRSNELLSRRPKLYSFSALPQTNGFQQQLDSWNAYDPKTPLYYVLNRVKGFTAEMAAKNTTPFIHGHLYREYRPRCIMSVSSSWIRFFLVLGTFKSTEASN